MLSETDLYNLNFGLLKILISMLTSLLSVVSDTIYALNIKLY